MHGNVGIVLLGLRALQSLVNTQTGPFNLKYHSIVGVILVSEYRYCFNQTPNYYIICYEQSGYTALDYAANSDAIRAFLRQAVPTVSLSPKIISPPPPNPQRVEISPRPPSPG